MKRASSDIAHSIFVKGEIFDIVAKVAEREALETYVIGGYVRDCILKRPSKDIDFVCVGSGIKLARAVGMELGQEPIVYKSFGTARLVGQGGEEYEFVGARKESYRADSRNPIVEDGSLEDDQNRRDLTINALAISLNRQDFGRILDPFGGLEDLENKILRTPLDPEITFSDDPLRMMRAIRFASQLNFDIDGDTFQAITDQKERIHIVSQERITDELNKIILSPKPSYGFKLLFHTGLLKEIFPEMVDLHGVETIRGKSHKDNFFHTLQVLDNVAEVSDDLWLRWAAILHDIAKPRTKRFHDKQGWTFHGHEERGARMTKGLFRKLKLPMNEKMRFVRKLVRLHLRPIALVSGKVTDTAVRRLLFEAGDDIEALMKLCRADITSKNDVKVKKYLANFDKVEQKMLEVEEKDRIRNFQPPISGELIMTTFDIGPCREIGEIKDSIKDAILEGEISNEYEEAYKLMIELALAKGLKPVKN